MYCDFYNLTEKPFNVTPDPKFLYLNARYREALATLHYGITERKGFVTLIGEAGTGKTTLLNKLLDQLEPATKTVFLFNTNVSFEDILEYIFSEFDLPVHSGKKLYMLQRLNAFLLDELRAGGNVALLIDEAQDLDIAVLEDLRLLSNLETAKEKILQIVLSGQPELAQKLANPALRQLRQRIAINCRLNPLSREEVSQYIQFRLQAAGCSDPKMFTRDAEEEVWRYSQGIPRLVNVVCDNALVIGYALGKKRIDAEVAKEASADLLTAEQEMVVTGVEPEATQPGPALEIASVPPAAQSRRTTWVLFGVVALALIAGFISMGRSMLRDRETSVAKTEEPVENAIIRPGAARSEDVALAVVGEHRGEPVVRPAAPLRDAAVAERAVPREVAPRSTLQETGTEALPLPEPEVATAGARKPDPAEGSSAAGMPGERPQAMQAGAAVAANAPAAEVGQGPNDAAPQHGDAPASDRAPDPPPAAAAAPVVENAVEPAAAAGTRAETAAVAEPPAAEPVRPNAGNDGVEAAAAAGEPEQVAAIEKTRAVEEVAGRPVLESESRGGGGDLQFRSEQMERVVAQAGDSVGAIAVRKYGRASYTILDLLKLANPDLQDVDRISTGQVIALPELSGSFPIVNDRQNRFRVLVHSTPSVTRATSLADGLRRLGFQAQVTRGQIGVYKTIHRVLLGPVGSEAEALAISDAVRRAFRENEPLARLGRY